MPRDLPIGNGQMLVTFDQAYQIRDIFFPHVGQENHGGGGPSRFGVWAALPVTPRNRADRRKQRLFWSDKGWQIDLRYEPDTLATRVVLSHEQLLVDLHCTDVVDLNQPVMVRRIEVFNRDEHKRTVRLFHHNNFSMFNSRVGDTAYFDPELPALIHYRRKRYLFTSFVTDAGLHIDQYATGLSGFQGAEGTWRDAEDGFLSNNPIAQGAVDSTMMVSVELAPHASQVVYMVLGAGYNRGDVVALRDFIDRETPQGVIDRTSAYWCSWLDAPQTNFHEGRSSAPDARMVDLYRRSLLVVRTQIDNSGAIIAANDSDIMQFSRDTYSYLWPRDGAMVAAALDEAGFPTVTRTFYELCAKLIDERGFFHHKYNPDGSPASSWHPWVSIDKPTLPIQEDATALVLWGLWRHYQRYRDLEFVRPLWRGLVMRAADFMVDFCDPRTHLPLPSYDLWEERWGVHAYTVASVFAGLTAAKQFARCFGDTRRARKYEKTAQQIHDAFDRHFWSESEDRYLRRIVPLDHDHTARLIGQVQTGLPMGHETGGDPPSFEYDNVIDSSMYSIFALGMHGVDNPRVEKTMQAIEDRLWVQTPVGGLARYEGDNYHRTSDDICAVPGNPWILCTLWLAEWRIAKAQNPVELEQALPIFEWACNHALPSGVLAEQVHPMSNDPLSVSPLTWSHATVVYTLLAYLRKLDSMGTCTECGREIADLCSSISDLGESQS